MRLNQESSGPQSSSCRQTPESAFCKSRRPIFNAPEGAGGAFRSCQGRKAVPAARHQNRLSARAEGRFSMHPKGREGAAACPGPLKMHRVPQKAVLRTRISVRYQRRGFPVPNITPVPEKPVLRTECLRKRIAYYRRLFCAPNICSVPEKGVSGTEYHSRTREACFLHRVP